MELSKFLIIPNPGSEQETVTVRNNKITVTSKLTGTPITSYELWLSAWANYEEVLMRYLPPEYDVYRRCNAYRRFIHEAQKNYKWPAVYLYDTKFRRSLAESRSLAFDGLDLKSYALVLNSSQLRDDIKRCHRCDGIGHFAKSCPFPESAQVEKKEKKVKKEKTAEVCNNFNAGRCNNPFCTRLHVCKHCHGSSPATTCGCRTSS